jgi:predicted transglutaminase-like cysteine proteinase
VWASQLPPDLRLVRSDTSSAAGGAATTGQYQGYAANAQTAVATGILEHQQPFQDPYLNQQLEKFVGKLVTLSPGDKEACRRFLAEGCWAGMSATDVRAIQKLLLAVLQPAQQTAMGLSVDHIRSLTQVQSLMGMRHEPTSEITAQMRDDLLASQGISENEQKFRSSLHLIDPQADGVRVLADELFRTGQLTSQSSLKEIAEKSLALVQTRFNYIKEPNDPDGTEQDRWQSIAETMSKGGGDCEDLAMLQASLLMNLMEQVGYSKKDIRERVFISGGYMSDAAGNQKGHVVVRLQMDSGDLALDATGNSAPSRFDGLNFDVVFEANDWEFNKLQEIDPAFVTSLDVTGSDEDSIIARINALMALLEEQLKTIIDIPLPKTSYSNGVDDFFGFGTEDIMQREILDADGRGTGEMRDITSTEEFSFFTLHYDTYTPPDHNNRLYSAEIKEEAFLEYVNMTRNLTNEILMLYHIGNSYLDFVANEATEIGLSGFDENTKSEMQQVMSSGDKYKGKMVGAMNNFLQKSNNYIQQVSSQIFQFVDSNNSAQLQMAQYKIDNYGRESMFTALPSAIVDELTNALQMVRIAEKVSVTNKMAKLAADNMVSYTNYALEMTDSVRLWAEGTTQSEVTGAGPMNFGQKIWTEMEGASGSKSKYIAYLEGIRSQAESIKSKMTTTPTFSSQYGLSTANMNQGSLEGDLFASHGDTSQFVQVNMDQMAKLAAHNADFQNMVGISLLIQQTLQDIRRDVASSIGGKKTSSSSSQIGAVALMSLGAELAKQESSLRAVQSASANLASQATDLMAQRINYQKETARTIAKAVKFALEIAGSILGHALGASLGTSFAVIYSAAYATPFWLPLMTNPFTAAFGVAGFSTSFGEAMAVYGGPTGLWTDYWSRNTSDTVSAALTLAYVGTDLGIEIGSKEAGTTRFIQEGNTFGRDENGASEAGGPLAAAESQTNTDIWSDGETAYYTNRTVAKVLTARDNYNMEVNKAVSVGVGTASGERNTQRTEFIMDQGNGALVLNGFLMGSREADTAMLQGSVYALVGIFRAQRDAMENIISQAFGVQKAGKANAMGEQIGRTVAFEQQLVSIYKQDSQQRMQAMNMMVAEDKRQTNLEKDLYFQVAQTVVTLLGWTNVPIPTVFPFLPAVTAQPVYSGYSSLLGLSKVLIQTAEALYKYELGPYSDNFSDYYNRDLNAAERVYRDELQAAVNTDVPDSEGMDTASRFERLDILEKQQLAKLADYGGGVGSWGNNVGGDSIMEYSNGKVGDYQFTFRQVNYGLAAEIYNNITEITSLRVFYAMIDQALYQQKQNVFRNMFGVASSADPIATMMSLLDSYNSSILNGAYDSLVTEAGSRATAYNAYENNEISSIIEYTTIGLIALANVPILYQFFRPAYGGGGYQGIANSAKMVSRLSSAARIVGAGLKLALGSYLMTTVKGSTPNVDSSMATYDENEDGEPVEGKKPESKQEISRGRGGQQRVSMAEMNRQQTLARRRERQITLMREISLALADATADAAEDVGGVSSSKSYKGITKIISTFAAADVKQADFTYKALKQQADAYNRGVQNVMDGASGVLMTGMSALAQEMKWNADDKKKEADKLKGPDGKATKESQKLTDKAENLGNWVKRIETYGSVLSEALIETVLFLSAVADRNDMSLLLSDDSAADAQVDGDSEADGGDGEMVASTDNLENSLLGISLMQANVSLLTELMNDRATSASKMASGPAKAIKGAIQNFAVGRVKDKLDQREARKNAEAEADLEDMDTEDLEKLAKKANGVTEATANAAGAANMDKVKFITAQETGKAPADVTPDDIKNKYNTLKSEVAALHQKGGFQNRKLDKLEKDDLEKKTGELKTFDKAFSEQAKSAVKGSKEAITQLTDKEKRQFTILAKLGVAGGTPEQMFAAIQKKRVEKGIQEGRVAASAQGLAEAQAGMASKDGLGTVRKQQFELEKLQKSEGLGDVNRVDVLELGDGDPGEGDPRERQKNKDDAIDAYVDDKGRLNKNFDALSEADQVKALVRMGMAEDKAVARLEFRSLGQEMQAVLEGGKVAALPESSWIDTLSSRTLARSRMAAASARDKYVGADGRLNRDFYSLGKQEQAAALKTMGVSADVAAAGTQVYQDKKMAAIKEKTTALLDKLGAKVDAQVASGAPVAPRDMAKLRGLAEIAEGSREREREALGLETLYREQGASVADLDLGADPAASARKDDITKHLQKLGYVDAKGRVTADAAALDVTKPKSSWVLNGIGATAAEAKAVQAVLSGAQNKAEQSKLQTNLSAMTDTRPAERIKLRAEMNAVREALNAPLTSLAANEKTALLTAGLIDADGKAVVDKRDALRRRPADADTVFAGLPGVDSKRAGELRALVLGDVHYEKLAQLQGKLDKAGEAGLSFSARERLAVKDSTQNPESVRAQLQAQAVVLAQNTQTTADIQKSGFTPFRVSALSYFGSSMSLAQRREADKNYKRAEAAEGAGINREAAARRFQARIDQMTGVSSGARAAKGFVGRLAAAKEKNAKNELGNRDLALMSLVVDRDATTEVKALMSEGKMSDAGNVLRSLAASGSDGQAVAANVLRRMAASGDDVGALLDKATMGASQDQLRGLGVATLQAGDEDTRFAGKLSDRELGRLYGLTGWHTDKVAISKAEEDAGFLGKNTAGIRQTRSLASQKGDRAATQLMTALANSSGFAKALSAVSVADMKAAKLSPTQQSRIKDSMAAFSPSVGDAMTDARVTADTVVAGASDRTEARDAEFAEFEDAMKSLLQTPDSPEKLNALRTIVQNGGDLVMATVAAAAILGDPVSADTQPVDADMRREIQRAAGAVISKVSGSFQSDISLEINGVAGDRLSPSSTAPLLAQSQSFVNRSQALLNQRFSGVDKGLPVYAQRVLSNLERLSGGMPDADLDEIATYAADGLKASFSEASVPSDYFKKLNDAVPMKAKQAADKEAGITEKTLPRDSSVDSLAEILQKMDENPAVAGAELEKVKDRVARVIEEAVSQGNMEDVIRVLGKLRQQGLTDLIQDLGTLVTLDGDGAALKEDLQAYEVMQDVASSKRTADQENRREALELFTAARIGPNTRIVDQMVQGVIDTRQKQVALDKIADRIASGDVVLLEKVLGDTALRQDLAQLVAQGVALDLPSAYKLLDKVSKKHSEESKLFAEALGAHMVVINREIKTDSRKGDVKKIREHLQSLAKDNAGKKEAAAFVTQINNGYGVQLYSSPNMLSRTFSGKTEVNALDKMVKAGATQTAKAQDIFKVLAMNNPRSAGNMMTEAMNHATPTLATTLYEGVSKEIPGANGRTMTNIQSLLTTSLAALHTASAPLSTELGDLKSRMERDLISVSTQLAAMPPAATSVASSLVVTGNTLGVPEDQKALVSEQFKQGLGALAEQLGPIATEAELGQLTDVFNQMETDPAGMTESDFQLLLDMSRGLPEADARSVRLQVGVAAMLALPEGTAMRAEMQNQQVADMIVAGQGGDFTSGMVSDMLASNVAGKMDALQSLLAHPTGQLDLTSDNTMGAVLNTLTDLRADGAQANQILKPGSTLDQMVKDNLADLSMSDVIAFSHAQMSAGLTFDAANVWGKAILSPENAGEKASLVRDKRNGKVPLSKAMERLNLSDSDKSRLSEMDQLAGLKTTWRAGKVPAEIKTLLNDKHRMETLKTEQPKAYLQLLIDVSRAGVPVATNVRDDFAAVKANKEVLAAHVSGTATETTIETLQNNIVLPFIAGDPQAATALLLMAKTSPGTLSGMFSQLDSVTSGGLANKIQSLALSPSLDMSSLVNSVPALREKSAVGDHAVLRQLSQSALTKHNRGASSEGELAAMGSHVRLHEDSFKTALKTAMTGASGVPDDATVDAKFDSCLSSEAGLSGMIFLLDAQTKTLAPNTPDARHMTAAKLSLTEMRVGDLIRNDDDSIAGMDRQEATILVDTLRSAKDTVMPRLAPFLKDAAAGDRLMALIGQTDKSLVGSGAEDMQTIRGELMTAAGILDMNDVASAASTIRGMRTDLAAKTLAKYQDPAVAADILRSLDRGMADAIVGKLSPADQSRLGLTDLDAILGAALV